MASLISLGYIGLAISGGLFYIWWTMRSNRILKEENKTLAKKKEYHDKVIEDLTQRPTVDNAIDSLQKGDF